MEFEKVIKTRTATRGYSSKKVDKEIVDKILEAGRIAPTAKNLQPFKIYVIESPEGLKKVDKASPCRYNAPLCLLVCENNEEAFEKEGHSTGEMDSCIVATHMMLAATNEGVDNIWVEMFDPKIMRKEFDIPKELNPICLLPMGYKSKDCKANIFHTKRKKIEEITEYK